MQGFEVEEVEGGIKSKGFFGFFFSFSSHLSSSSSSCFSFFFASYLGDGFFGLLASFLHVCSPSFSE